MTKGRLRVYLGAAPGVGKTFTMLNEGRRRAERGTDVVVGLVETHGRARTAEQLGDLEVLPRRSLSHRGATLIELDLEAVLLRAPEVVLVDELAHTNAPGSVHAKRWQDVEAILAAGIDVITTVNIQHLESLNDVVEAITGIRQQETVPDAVVRRADQIELVDMSPQALRRRLAHGNVYAAEKVDAALSNYFREGNLSALRELALLWLAERVDEGLERYRDDHRIHSAWPTRERIVVALTGGPESETLLRRAARMSARSTGGEWHAVYVSRRDGLATASPARVGDLRTMTEDLSGSFHLVVGDDVAHAILDFARGLNASQILLGLSRRSRWSAPLRSGVGETVIAGSGDMDVHMVAHDYVGRGRLPGGAAALGRRRSLLGWGLAIPGPALVTALISGFGSEQGGLPAESLLFMSLVVTAALAGGLWPAVTCSLLSGIALNYFFTEPVRTLKISSTGDAIAIALFVVVAVAVALVVDLAARRTSQAARARAEADALAALSRGLLGAGDDLDNLLDHAREVFGMRGAALFDTSTEPATVIATAGESPVSLPAAACQVPVEPGLVMAMTGALPDAADQSLLQAFAAHASVLLERRRASEQAVLAHQLAEGNKIRTALLTAVSHDLRSPLAAIKAAVSSLLGTEITWSPSDERALLETIDESTDRLDALVGNLLDMSRLQAGALNPLMHAVDLAEVVQASLHGLPERQRVAVEVMGPAPLVHADPGLVERVLANLVENACRHSPEPVLLRVCGWRDTDGRRWGSVRVVDSGPGVPADARDAIFEPFQRLGDVPAGDGVGLGLAVARGLTESMGGRLTADDTPGGGLTMVVDLAQEPGEEAA